MNIDSGRPGKGVEVGMDESTRAMREKYWSELDSEQKIKRMRGIVRAQQQRIDRLERFVELFKHHEHLEGDILVPLEDPGAVHTCLPVDLDQVYF